MIKKPAHVPGLLCVRWFDGMTADAARQKLESLGAQLKVEKMEAEHGFAAIAVPPEDDEKTWIDRVLKLGFTHCFDASK